MPKSTVSPGSWTFSLATSISLLSGAVLVVWMVIFGWYILDHKHNVINEVDCEGYFLIGKSIAEGNVSAWDEDYFRYHGHPYIAVGENKAFSKYPPGYPVLLALGYWVGGFYGALWVNTLCGWLFILAFGILLIRLFNTTVAAVLFPLCVFFSFQTLHEIVYPYAHGPDLAFSVLALLLVTEYARRPSVWLGVFAGAALILMPAMRPTSLLYIPAFSLIAWSQYQQYHTREPGTSLPWIRLLWPLCIGLVGTACIWAGFNGMLFGGPLSTGYELSDEQHAFSLSRFFERWQELVTGKLPYVWPTWALIVAGISWIWGVWRKPWLGAGLFLWVIPVFVLYGSYYWYSPSMGTSYSRFYTSFLPAFVLAWGCVLIEFEGRIFRSVMLVVGSVLVCVFMPDDFNSYSRKIQYTKKASLMAALRDHVVHGDVIYTSNHWQGWNLNVWPGVTAYGRRVFYDKDFTRDPREIKSFSPWRDGKRYRDKYAYYQSLADKGDLMYWHIREQLKTRTRVLLLVNARDRRWFNRYAFDTVEIIQHMNWRLLVVKSAPTKL